MPETIARLAPCVRPPAVPTSQDCRERASGDYCVLPGYSRTLGREADALFSFRRLSTLASTLSHLTGVELSEQDGTTLHLTLTQSIPRAMPGPLLASPPHAAHHLPQPSQPAGTQDSNMVLCSGGGSLPDASQGFHPTQATGSSTQNGEQQCIVVEHVLTLEFEPGAMLRDAGLSPAVVDISEDVRAARAAQGASGPDAAALRARALADLVVDVKARVRRHCRRQVLLEGACGAGWSGAQGAVWAVTWRRYGTHTKSCRFPGRQIMHLEACVLGCCN